VIVHGDRLEVRLFGGFSLSCGGEALPPLPSRQARLLFAWLVLHAGRPQPRSVLADRFWPEVAESRGRRRLSHALWQVQDALAERTPGHGYLTASGDAVTFDVAAPYWLDVEEFEQRLDRVDAAGAIDGAGLRDLERCVDLYQGELLAGSYEPWVVAEQDRLRQRYVTALGRLVDGCKQRGNFADALAFARRVTHEAPLREDAHREVMRLCVLLGQPSQALEQFERCRSVLTEELGTEPSAATLQLRERILQTRDAGTSRRAPVDQLISRRLVGRDDARVTLVDQLERTLAGSTGMVFVEGEPGIGKTTLLAQAAEDARWRGFTVLWGACPGADVAYGPISEALLPELGPVRVAQLRAHVEPVWLREASQLIPTLAALQGTGSDGSVPTATLAAAQAAERMREALVQVVRGLAAIDPLLLVIEDVHRADQETLSLLRRLSRASSGRLCALLSFRDVDAREDPSVWSTLRAVDRDARPVRIRLEPLSAFETAGLLREVLGATEVPAGFAGAMHREGGGNPLYVLEILRAMRDAGSLTDQQRDRLDTVTVPVTEGLRTVIGGRLDALDAPSNDIVGLAAVLGPEFPLDTLRLASGLDQRELTTVVGELVRRNVLQVTGDRCRFSHAATCRVALSLLEEERARELHAIAGSALETTHPEQAEALASHFRRAGQPRRALPYLRAAADRALTLHAYGTAAGHLTAAVAFGARVPMATEERFDLLTRLETVLDVIGWRDRQAAVLDELTTFAGTETSRVVEAQLRRATYLGHIDRFDDAVMVAREAVERASAAVPVLRARALTALGRVLGWSGQNDAAVDALQGAVDLLGHDDAAASRTRVELATAQRFLQRFDQAGRELEQALVLAEANDDPAGTVEALGALADLAAETGRTDEAVDLHDRAIALARRIGYRHREGVGLVNLGTVRLTRGEPALALAAYDHAIEVFDALGNHRGVAMVQVNRAWTRHRWLGQDDDAGRDARAALHYFEPVGYGGAAAVCLETLAGVARRRGELERAAGHLADGLAAAREAGDRRAEVQLLRGQIELALARGDEQQAASRIADALPLVRRLGITEFMADLTTLRALASLAAGDAPAAWAAAEIALAHLPTSAEPHRIHRRIARVAETTGRDDLARQHHVAAYRLLVDALDGLDARSRATAIDAVPEHHAIIAAGEAVTPRALHLRLAHRSAPRGRALEPSELVPVTVELVLPAASASQRREQVLAFLDQVRGQDALATVADLAAAFDVSESTIQRDLRALRSQGHTPATRGTETA
jgi:DNA-binding SARP family transcriptional activator/tetratricopeptide (TPR) repeat protein